MRSTESSTSTCNLHSAHLHRICAQIELALKFAVACQVHANATTVGTVEPVDNDTGTDVSTLSLPSTALS